MAILLPRSLNRTKSSLSETRDEEKEREALRVSWELVEYRAWLSDRKYSCFIETDRTMHYCHRLSSLVDFISS